MAILLTAASYAASDLTEIGVGARTLGLGRAFSGGVNDAAAIFTNPAGLTLSDGIKIMSMSGTLLSDVNYLVLGVGSDVPVGKIGVGYISAGVSDITLTQVVGTGSSASVEVTGISSYTSSLFFLSYASELSRFFRGNLKNVSVGANLKYYLQGFSGGGSVMQDANGTGMDLDAGILWQASPWARLGLNANDILPSSLGGKFRWVKNGAEESIPYAARIGGHLDLIGDKALKMNSEQNMAVLFDYEVLRGDNEPKTLHLGCEYSPLKVLALRIGIDQKAKADLSGVGVDNNLTAGVGIYLGGFSFDYAYHQFGEISGNTTHFFSIGYKEPISKKKKFLGKPAVSGSLPTPIVVPKPILKTYSDVSADYWAKQPIEYLATMNIMPGFSDGTFHPEQAITRAELAEILVKAKGFNTAEYKKLYYKDVSPSNPAASYINVVIARKYMDGYADGTFRPDKKVTRAEAAIIFARYSGLYVKDKVQEKVFPDVPRNHIASPAMAASKEAGYFEYLSDQRFNPALPLTRAEAAEMLSKTAYVKEKIKNFIAGEK
ncbi:MAG: S-layer homology domain-containing protein [Candidatus Margulisbacteria bacterium]|nr:S-layer homology domain-containing protein [Candidatus Margulisiibacteriota bacterium]